MLIRSRYIGVILLMAFLSGCASLGKSNDVSLNITGVDYAGTGMDAYQVKDPDNPKNRGGGFSIRPYSADGVQCCYTVPKEWHPGLKATVLLRYPLEGETGDEISASLAKRQAEGTLVETYQVEIPRYTTPAKGTLWVQFLPNKHVSLVVSDLDPSHKDFPGKVKGWPVPSVEYINSKIMQKIDLNNGEIKVYEKAIKEHDGTPERLRQYQEVIEQIKEENKKYQEMLR